MSVVRKHLRAAVDNVAKYGDTDVFPFPIENHVFFDKPAETVDLLHDLHKSFDEALKLFPLVHESNLSAVGYTGFRWASQIDPFWNAYLLALVISIAPDIEAARIPTKKEIVFSYRFKLDPSEKSIFDKNIGWVEFQRASVRSAREHAFVLVCDISDFYPRVYHHRLENALKRATKNSEVVRRIKELLIRISKGASYGLPVGGPAARLLSELLLNRVDRLLLAEGVRFRRFVDEYHIYSETREQAYAHLVSLSSMLLENEGLSLQKMKTRIMTSQEFLTTSQFAEESVTEDAREVSARSFLSLRLY